MSEDKFEEFLQREARAYNAPPEAVPRDGMWRAIRHSRATARRRVRYAPWIGMAATLLVGVGIGRFAMDRGPASLLQDTLVTVDSRSAVVDAPDSGDAPATGHTPIAGAERALNERRSRQAGQATNAAAGSLDLASAPVTAPEVASAPVSPRESTDLSPTYEVASQRHLQRAEALVAVVAAAPRDPMMDSLTSLWARDVLSNTRLLLDSPVGDDPIRRRLLEDLENLLVQLVQRSGPAVQERELIDRTLQRTQLLTRLRTSASGT